MAEGIEFRVITPDGLFHHGKADSVMLKTTDGWLGLLPGRAPFCALLAEDGCLRFKARHAEFQQARLHGGFAIMDDHLMIYAETATWAAEEAGN